MKTASQKNVQTSRSKIASKKKPRTTGRKPIDNKDVNVDDELTNADVSDNDNSTNEKTETSDNGVPINDSRSITDLSVEDEQDREALRKMEDNHPDEAMN